MEGKDIVFYLFGGLIMAAAGLAAVHHFRQWRGAPRNPPPEANALIEWAFHVRQQRRRFQIALLGLFGGLFLTLTGYVLPRSPIWGVWLTVFAILSIVWALAVALLDIISIQAHFRLMRNRHQSEQMQFEAEIRRAAEASGKGESGNGNGERKASESS